MTVLNEDRVLLRRFLGEVAKVDRIPKGDLLVSEQSLPDGPRISEDEARRLPDAWIFDTDGWCLVVESKVLARIDPAQISGHIRMAQRRGFKSIRLLLISAVPSAVRLPALVTSIEWKDVYSWLVSQRTSPWSKHAARYLEIAEATLTETGQLVDGTLTRFEGVPFGAENPFDYIEAKRLLRLAIGELRQRKDLRSEIGMDPALPSRSAITGRSADSVWDFLQISRAKSALSHTKNPHLTLNVSRDHVEGMITIPNSVDGLFRRRLTHTGLTGFESITRSILKQMMPVLRSEPGAVPLMRGVQRHYQTQRSTPEVDALVQFDIRTAFQGSGEVKTQPEWLDLAYRVFTNKKSNFQLQIGMQFKYANCELVSTRRLLDLVANAWIACRPILEVA